MNQKAQPSLEDDLRTVGNAIKYEEPFTFVPWPEPVNEAHRRLEAASAADLRRAYGNIRESLHDKARTGLRNLLKLEDSIA